MIRTKVKQVKDPHLIEMFNQMVNGEGDPEVVAQKFTDMKSMITSITSVINGFTNPDGAFAKKFPEYKSQLADMKSWGDRCKALTEFKTYAEIRDHVQLKDMITLTRHLVDYATPILAGSTDWVDNIPGIEFVPFSFTKLDLKYIWSRGTPESKKYVMVLISILFKSAKKMHDLYSSPDINKAQFSQTLMASVEKISHTPELHRCKKAFKEITKSVNMLENNFTTYYRDMVDSQNPNTIIESFINDVAKESASTDPGVLREFNQIVAFCRKQSGSTPKDPKVKKLMETISNRLKSVNIDSDSKEDTSSTSSSST